MEAITMTPRRTLADYAAEANGDDSRGLRCPKCGCGHFIDAKPFEVAETMPRGPRYSIQRRRRCRHCGNLFSTYERAVEFRTGTEEPAGE